MGDYDNPMVDFDTPPQLENTYRLKLSYDNLDYIVIDSIRYSKPCGGGSEEQPLFTNIKTVSVNDPNAYVPDDTPPGINFIYETGELILHKNVYEEFRTADNIQITYTKSALKRRSQTRALFQLCYGRYRKTEKPPVNYVKQKQEIKYEINYNQKLAINTEGSDAISHKIGTVIDDIVKSVDDVIQTESKIAEVKKRMQDINLTEDQVKRYEKMLEQLEIELTLKKEVMQKAFARGITCSNEEQDRVNVAIADLGSRHFRLNLTENRLSTQQVDFKELLSRNEDVDIVEALINFNAAQILYNSSLSAAARVVQNSLLDFL